LSHFLGRFRRENYLTATQLGKLTGLGAVNGRGFNYHPGWGWVESSYTLSSPAIPFLFQLPSRLGMGWKESKKLLMDEENKFQLPSRLGMGWKNQINVMFLATIPDGMGENFCDEATKILERGLKGALRSG
jgi:hypothetical protein